MIQAHYKREESFAMHYLTYQYSIAMFTDTIYNIVVGQHSY